MRVFEWQTRMRKETERVGLVHSCGEPCTMGRSLSLTWIALEHICWDPKDGELCLNRVKPGETLVEARRHSDVQIDVQIWV
jgi:hypothetical protein